MPEIFESHSEEETMEIAGRLAASLGPGDIVGLTGDLGAGKTRFVKGVAKALGIDPESVNSPTFTLIQEYAGRNGLPLYHFDCYRIKSAEEALEIGSEEYFYGDGVSVIEWPEKIEEILPTRLIRVTITVIGPDSRRIEIDDPGSGEDSL